VTLRKLPALAGAAVLALGLAACGGESVAGPDDAAVAFFSAVNTGDCERAEELVHSSEDIFGQMCPMLVAQFEDEDFAPTVDEVTENGDTATVTMTYDGTPEDISMVKVDGAWKVDLDEVF